MASYLREVMRGPLSQRTDDRSTPDSYANQAVPGEMVVGAQNDIGRPSSKHQLLAFAAATPSGRQAPVEAEGANGLPANDRRLVQCALRLVTKAMIDRDRRMVLALDGEDDERAAVDELAR